MVSPVFKHNLKLEVSESKHTYVFITMLAIGLIVLSTQKLPLAQFQGIGSLGSNVTMYVGAGLIVLTIATPFIVAKRLSRPLEDEEIRALRAVVNDDQYVLLIQKKDNKMYYLCTDQSLYSAPVNDTDKPLPTKFYKAAIALKDQWKKPIFRELDVVKVAAYRDILRQYDEFYFKEIGCNILKKVEEGENDIEEVREVEDVMPTDLLELRLQNLPKKKPKA